jgi:hypothetical protein
MKNGLERIRNGRSGKRISFGSRFSHSSSPILDPTRPHIHGYRVFALGKAEGVGVDHLPLSSAEVKRV